MLSDMVRYNVIYVDPPLGSGKADRELLGRLPIGTMAQDQALLFLWFPPAELEGFLSVLNTWGFSYLRLLTWRDKSQEVVRADCSRCEHLLVGIRGLVRVDCLQRENLFDCWLPKWKRHPPFFRDLAVQAANRAFAEPELMDVFGEYWQALDADYQPEEWEFWEGIRKQWLEDARIGRNG